VEPRDRFLLELLDMQSSSLRHAVCALVSVVASTGKGVEYLVSQGMGVVDKVVRILKEGSSQKEGAAASGENEGDGSVTQRFCIAILQKMSVKEEVVTVLIQRGMI
jgi:hypothetical protein